MPCGRQVGKGRIERRGPQVRPFLGAWDTSLQRVTFDPTRWTLGLDGQGRISPHALNSALSLARLVGGGRVQDTTPASRSRLLVGWGVTTHEAAHFE